MNFIFLIFKNQFRKFIYLLFLFLLVSCIPNHLTNHQFASIGSLSKALRSYAMMVGRVDIDLVLETFYVDEHAEQITKKYDNNVSKWLKDNEASRLIMEVSLLENSFFCPIAYRRKSASKRFSPRYMIYYNLQSMSCNYINSKDAVIFHSGQMEWGYESNKKRWIHLRKLD